MGKSLIDCIAPIAAIITAVATVPLAIQRWKDVAWRKKREDAVRDDSDIGENVPICDQDDIGICKNPKSKALSRYSLNGHGNYGKGRLVLAVIRSYVETHSGITYDGLMSAFPKQLRGVKNRHTFWGCINLKRDAVSLYAETGRKRHFLEDDEIITLADGTEVAVSSQWGDFNIDIFIKGAQDLGFTIKEIFENDKATSKGDKSMKVATTIIISLLTAAASSFAAMLEQTVDGIVWQYSTSNGKATIGSGASGYNGLAISRASGTSTWPSTLVVPSQLGGCPVVKLNARAFYNGSPNDISKVKEIVLPESLTTIANEVFSYSGITKLTIPANVTSIGHSAFYECWSLKSVAFSESRSNLSLDVRTFNTTGVKTVIYHRVAAPTVSGNFQYIDESDFTIWTRPASSGWSVSIPGKWKGVNIKYLKSVAFDANGGTVSAEPRYLIDGSAIGTLPTPARTGHTFAGWFTATSGESQVNATTTVSANVTYYAHWTVNKYTITFNANGGEGGTSKSLSYDTTLGTLPEATRYDFDFGGWWTAAIGGSVISSSTKVTGAATYYAHWIDPIPELTGVVTDEMVSEALSGSTDDRITSKIITPSSYNEYRQWINNKGLSHKAAKASPNAWLSYALDAPGLMAKATALASEDVVIESIAPSSAAGGAFDLVVNIADAEIGEGARLAEVLGVEGATELRESAFSSEGLTVTLERTNEGKTKATVTPDGAPPVFFLRVKVK